MRYIIELVKNTLEDKKQSAEEQLQLNKICELEDKFIKGFSKEKLKEYFDLDIEKGQLHNLEIDHIIEITFKICSEIFNQHNL